MGDEFILFNKFPINDEESIKGFTPQALSVVRTVLERCKKECEQNALQVPLDQFLARVSYYTSYPPAVISKLKDYNERAEKTKKEREFDVAERIIFIRILQNLYLQEKSPTYSDIFEGAKKSIEITSLYLFRKDLFKFGFYYMPTTTGFLLTEDPKIRFERFHFLNKLNKIRNQGTPIYYIDERLMDPKNLFEKPGKISDKEYLLIEGSYLLIHTISSKEIKNCFMSNVVSTKVFTKWVFDVLLKSLNPGGVIIMDNNPIHGKLISNEITRYHTKEEMIKCLQLNNVPCNEDMHKAELYELVQKLTRKEQFYELDRLLRAFGFDVLRLPFGCKNLSMTELLWNHLKTDLKSSLPENQSPSLAKDLIIAKVNALLVEKWNDFENTIIKWENELLSMDIMTEKILDKSFRFDVNKITATSPEDKYYKT